MMERTRRSDLVDLAVRLGVQPTYADIQGIEQTASTERLLQVLRALGVPIHDPSEAASLARHEMRTRWSTPLESVIVAWDGRGSAVVRIPASFSDAPYRLTVNTEDGHVLSAEGSVKRGVVVEDVDLDGQSWTAWRLPLPANIPIGHHSLELELGHSHEIASRALLLSAPRRVYAPANGRASHAQKTSGSVPGAEPPTRTWGVFVPLYALHGERSAGIGDLTDMRELIDWVGAAGGSVVGTLPLLAAFLDDPCEPSPYSPVSRLAWNEIYLDPAVLPEVRDTSASYHRWQQTARALARESGWSDLIDFAAVMARKRPILEEAAALAFESGGRRRDDLEAFRRARPEIDAYARFRAVGERLRQPWPRWPAHLRDGEVTEKDFDATAYRYHLYVQWSLHEQLLELSTQARSTGLGLYLDLPIGVHAHGFDTWREPHAFVPGLSTGAPPDTLFAGGQNWAFPPLHPGRQRDDHYRHIIAVLRNHLRYAGVLRIDHVMGLHRLYVIPEGAPATEGVYIRNRPEELYAILSIESHRAKAVLIGENLGTVPPAVQHAMDAHGVHGMHVVQYAVRAHDGRALPPASPGEIASLNTHDMPPFHAYWKGIDIEERRSLGWIEQDRAAREHAERRLTRAALRRFLGEEMALAPDADAAETARACLLHLARGHARIVMVTLEDLWGETRSQNVPGTWREHPNWCRRSSHAFEVWREMPEVLEVLRAIDRARRLPFQTPTMSHDITRIAQRDVEAITRGTHDRMHDVLGAHPVEEAGQRGTYFAVWAPAAERVSVIGDWIRWEPDRCPLRRKDKTGFWEGFLAGVEPGDTYKFHIRRAASSPGVEKADPFAFRAELAPRSASIVADLAYVWGDEAWMRTRTSTLDRAISIYEVHLGSWRRVPEEHDRPLGYREAAQWLARHLEALAFTHVLLMPVMEHPAHDAWGYEPTGLFAATSRFGSPRDLMFLVDHLHQRGIGVLFDCPLFEMSAVGHGLTRFDETPLFERSGELVFDLRRPEVCSFLTSSACHWIETFHADGLRIKVTESVLQSRDENAAVAAFLRHVVSTLHRRSPGIAVIADTTAPCPPPSGSDFADAGVDFFCDRRWRSEMLEYMACDPNARGHRHALSHSMACNERSLLALSHEITARESLAAQLPGDDWQKLANLRLLYGCMWTQPGKKLLFMGQELGQWQSSSAERSLDWHLLEYAAHQGILRWVADLNQLYRSVPALHELDAPALGGIEWIRSDPEHGVVSHLRHSRERSEHDIVLVVCNFTPIVRHGYRIGVPHAGTWYELLNSDATVYGGSGVGNAGRADAHAEQGDGHPHALVLTLPPLGVLVLGRRPR